MKKIKTSDLEYDFNKYRKDILLIYGLTFDIDNNILNMLNIETIYKGEVLPYTHGWIYWYFVFNSSKNNVFNNSINNSFSGAILPVGGGGGFTGGGGGGAGGGGAGGF